jgi:nitroreductase
MTDTGRNPAYPVAPIFLDRWSPRAFDETPIPEADLMTIFEAARWAPSAFNYQPWRLLYATREDADWERFLDLLIPYNRGWAHRAAVLIYFLSDTQMEMAPGALNPSHSHSFDTGAAWACLALQATMLGYHAHGMVGVDFERARAELKVPDRYRFEAAAVIGRIADKATLDEKLKAREVPSSRKPIGEFAFRGEWPTA